ncbi:MAG TPA: inositol monophosphatase family protein [Acidimicrobiales bacterium]|nr:inositol monophosphatase family protein [Acidimicrobiales bacterium]
MPSDPTAPAPTAPAPPAADPATPATKVAQADPDDLALALRVADLADRMTTAAFRRADLVVDTKPDRTLVTEADRGVEEMVRAELRRARPDDAVVGEEYGTTGAGRRRWIVDPIDGTHNFVRRIPVWATLLALEVDGVLQIGVASAPALGRRWWAGKGLGAWAKPLGTVDDGPERSQPQPIRVSEVAHLSDAQLTSCGPDGWEQRGGVQRLLDLSDRCWRDRAFGDFWSHVLVAEGACDIGIDPVVSLWDLAALQVIVEEAGGRFTDFEGVARADGGTALSTNGILHDETLAIIAPSGTAPSRMAPDGSSEGLR